MKRKPEDYLYSGFYDCNIDDEIRNQTEKIVKCRKPHECIGFYAHDEQKIIQPGEFALRETGFLPSGPVSCYTCIECLDKWLDEIEPEGE